LPAILTQDSNDWSRARVYFMRNAIWKTQTLAKSGPWSVAKDYPCQPLPSSCPILWQSASPSESRRISIEGGKLVETRGAKVTVPEKLSKYSTSNFMYNNLWMVTPSCIPTVHLLTRDKDSVFASVSEDRKVGFQVCGSRWTKQLQVKRFCFTCAPSSPDWWVREFSVQLSVTSQVLDIQTDANGTRLWVLVVERKTKKLLLSLLSFPTQDS
jgi:hypothetical protein